MAFPILAAIPVISEAVSGILDRFIPNAEEKAKAERELMSTVTTAVLANANAQIDVNKAEAASGNWFASSWRPLCGYVCALALAWQYLILPVMSWTLVYFNYSWMPPVISLDEHLWELLFGLLGMGGLRTLEKVKGVAK